MKDLILFPFGGNAREALLSITAINKHKPTWRIIGFLDDDKKLWKQKYLNIPILGGTNLTSKFPSAFFLPVPGNPDTFHKRERKIQRLKIPVNKYATIIDPSVRVANDSKIGKNALIMANVVISSGVLIGNHVVILPNTVVAHDTKIGDYSMVGAGAVISGYCDIAKNCYIGSGSNIKDHINIGKGSLVGLGSSVITNIPDGVVCAGNPAKILRNK